MSMMAITRKPIAVAKVLQSVATKQAGGIVPFIGSVRREGCLTGLFYECYHGMAVRQLKKITAVTRKKWDVKKIAIVHRIGWVAVGEPSIVIAVSAAHRRAAFAACRFVIDQIKAEVPIWKREGIKHL